MSRKVLLVIISIIAVLLAVIAGVFGYFFVGKAQVRESGIVWGVDFSQTQAEFLGLDWKEVYLAIINDLNVKHIKIHTQWDLIQGNQNDYNFSDVDWQIEQAEKNNVKIIYVLGLKTGRWPECHSPNWANNLSAEKQKTEILKYITEVVTRYKKSKAIINWQVENEPLFYFGKCPNWYYESDEFLKTEIALVKALDNSRQIIVSDSGEQSNWENAAQVGDIVGITMYRNAWTNITDTFGFNFYSFLNPIVYYKKSQSIKENYGKNVICVELQAEPWASKSLKDALLAEQAKSMNIDMFKENIDFAKQTGLDTFYFWGAEWWYWMKEKQNNPEIWNEASNLFKNTPQ